LSVVIDVFYPIDAITQGWPRNSAAISRVCALRIYVEALRPAIQPILDGRCASALSAHCGHFKIAAEQ